MSAGTYSVKERFLTLQGEGARAGAKSVFLRLAGCNLWDGRPEHRDRGEGECARWCDTDFAKGDKEDAETVVRRIDRLWNAGVGQKWVVVTGGEPLLQLDEMLVIALHKNGWKIAVETNGTVDNHAAMYLDWVTVSPKLGGRLRYVGRCDELKVVLPGSVKPGVEWTDEALQRLAEQFRPEHMFVQPMDPGIPGFVGSTFLHGRADDLRAQYKANMAKCVAVCMRDPRWRLCLQSHKYLGLP